MTNPDQSVTSGDKTYPIRTVARLTGLTPDLIRVWERRYGVVEPIRGPRGARLYCENDVARLRILARAVENGRSIGDVAHLPSDQLQRLFQPNPPPATAAASAPPTGPAGGIDGLLAAIDSLDMPGLERGLGDALLSLGASRFAHEVALPLLAAVGARWSDGRLSIGQEHLVSSALRNLLGALARSSREASAPSILLASPSGERHEFGLLMVAVLAADRGLGTYLLGVDIPSEDIADTTLKLRAGAVGLSLVAESNRLESARALRHLEETLPAGVEVWVGGGDAHNVLALVPGSRAHLIQTVERLTHHLGRFHARPALA
jgi:methylmalonyl-CoA mutase cobalamin-binding subunit